LNTSSPPHAEIQRIRIEQDAHLRLLGCRATFERVTLRERADRRGRAPRGFIETAVDFDRFRRTRGDSRARVVARARDLALRVDAGDDGNVGREEQRHQRRRSCEIP
jgi:hypothetical protein